MNEGGTTAIFGGVAAVALLAAWLSMPESISNEDDIKEERVGEDVFVGFDDPEAAASLQIVQYDEALAQLKRFEVARDSKTNLWNLPSHDDYPADAADQVRDATTPLVGLEILEVESTLRSDHELYGVVNPDEDIAAGASGVGMLVRFKDDKDQVLASLIIGKEVEQVEGQRYVRIPTEDAVYKVELDTAAFSTDFRKWIEGELLQVRSFDISEVGVRDYQLQQQSLSSMALIKNFDATVSYDSSTSKWSLDNFQKYEGTTPQAIELAENEELNSEFLNSLRTAVQDLEIVDVKRKPKGLAADLKADESLLQDNESIASLQRQGFYPAGGPDGTEIYAAGGETIIGTEDGVNYVLRFGEATASLSSSEEEEGSSISRYLLVTARLDQSKFPAPELEPLPETVEEMLARERAAAQPEIDGLPLDGMPAPGTDTAPSTGDATGSDATTTDTPAADTPTTEERPPSPSRNAGGSADAGGNTEGGDSPAPESSGTDETPAEETPAANSGQDTPADEPDADPEEPQESGQEPESTGSSGDTPAQQDGAPEAGNQESGAGSSTGETGAQPPQSNGESEATADGQTANDTKPEETEEELKERLEAVRDQITRDNQRLIDDRKEKLDAARKKVQELNARFSEWYYVVSEDVYQKLKISREDLIKTNEPEEESGAPNLSEGIQGLEGLKLP